MSAPKLSDEDLRHVLAHTGRVWEELRGQRVLITGGTGFVGTWLVESLVRANRELGLGASLLLITRRPAAFRTAAPHLAADPAITLLSGDLRDCALPGGDLRGVIHAASGYQDHGTDDPLACFSLEVDGTRRILELARERGARVLLTSSGAIYGPQPPGLTRLEESYRGGPDPLDPGAVYAHGKRAAELLCALYHRRHGVSTVIARCFALVGPRLPLRAGFAIGNFIADALAGGPIRVLGDGTPLRSYLYAADLAVWLWNIWSRGAAGRAYNVGSEVELPIAEVAREVARQVAPAAEVQIALSPTPGQPPQRYIPSTRRAREELGLRQHLELDEAIRRTAAWHRACRG